MSSWTSLTHTHTHAGAPAVWTGGDLNWLKMSSAGPTARAIVSWPTSPCAIQRPPQMTTVLDYAVLWNNTGMQCARQKKMPYKVKQKGKKHTHTHRQWRASPILACQWKGLQKRDRVKSDHYVSRILLCAHTANYPSGWLRSVRFKAFSCSFCIVLVYNIFCCGQCWSRIKGGDGNSKGGILFFFTSKA